MKLKVNDKVLVIAGKDKHKTGTIIAIDSQKNKVKIEKINLRTRHIKKRYGQAGDKVVSEGFISASNVMVIDPKTDKPTRVGYKKLANGKKERISKKSASALDSHTTVSKSKKAAKEKIKA